MFLLGVVLVALAVLGLLTARPPRGRVPPAPVGRPSAIAVTPAVGLVLLAA